MSSKAYQIETMVINGFSGVGLPAELEGMIVTVSSFRSVK